jgi:hypothetical protein
MERAMKYLQIGFIVTCLVVFLAAGFDKDDAYFEEVSFNTFSGTISESVALDSLPVGYSFVTTSACPSGFSEVSPGATGAYVKLGVPNTTATTRNIQVEDHHHTYDSGTSGNSMTTTTDAFTAGANAASSIHTHDYTHRHATGYMVFGSLNLSLQSPNTAALGYSGTTPSPGHTTTLYYSAVVGGSTRPAIAYSSIYYLTSYPLNSSGVQTTYTGGSDQSEQHKHLVADFAGTFNSAASYSGDADFDVLGDLEHVKVRLCEKT